MPRELDDIKEVSLILPGILITFCPSMKMFSFLDMQAKVFRGEMFKMSVIYFKITYKKLFKNLKVTMINSTEKSKMGMR